MFGSESYGLLTGTSGSVEYQMSEGQEPFVFTWDIPFFGENTIGHACGPAYRIGKEEQLASKSVTAVYSIHDPSAGDYRNNDTQIELVTKAPIIYESWKLELQKAARSILVTINNSTPYTLVLVKTNVRHGIWRLPPPLEVPPSTDFDFGAESHGITGTAGEVAYQMVNKSQPNRTFEETINFVWSVPIIGSNAFSSNMFAVAPQVDGEHSVVALHLTSDETFMLEVSETGVVVTSNKEQVRAKLEKTGYGFENEGDGTGLVEDVEDDGDDPGSI